MDLKLENLDKAQENPLMGDQSSHRSLRQATSNIEIPMIPDKIDINVVLKQAKSLMKKVKK